MCIHIQRYVCLYKTDNVLFVQCAHFECKQDRCKTLKYFIYIYMFIMLSRYIHGLVHANTLNACIGTQVGTGCGKKISPEFSTPIIQKSYDLSKMYLFFSNHKNGIIFIGIFKFTTRLTTFFIQLVQRVLQLVMYEQFLYRRIANNTLRASKSYSEYLLSLFEQYIRQFILLLIYFFF